jgi:signal transduction histidine kinase
VQPSDGLHVLVVTPTGRDAELIQNLLQASCMQSERLLDVAEAVKALQAREAGALLIAEEALGKQGVALLALALKEQPAWSALPILVLTVGGQETFQSRLRERQRVALGNTTLLERPIRPATLVSSVKAALHARSRQYERKLTEASLRQSDKLAALGRLASSIAHEINNPLEAVTNLLYLLDGTSLNEVQRGYLDTARQELARVSEIAAQTLTFNRERDIQGRTSVSTLLDSVLALYQGRLAGSDIVIERKHQSTSPFTCYPGELRQVFANLIGNAFDATRKGGRIILRERPARSSKYDQAGVRITVADTGHGIHAAVKSQLFQAFRSTKGSNGSGLGLWLSKEIIEKHGGSIQFRSSTKVGKSGTIISIFIPLKESGAPETGERKEDRRKHDRRKQERRKVSHQ